jgi:hypothetical protein
MHGTSFYCAAAQLGKTACIYNKEVDRSSTESVLDWFASWGVIYVEAAAAVIIL